MSWARGAAARTKHCAPAPHSTSAAPAPTRAARDGGGGVWPAGWGNTSDPWPKVRGPVKLPGAGTRKPRRQCGLRRPSPRPAHHASLRSSTPSHNCPLPLLTCHSGRHAPECQGRKEGRGTAAWVRLARAPTPAEERPG